MHETIWTVGPLEETMFHYHIFFSVCRIFFCVLIRISWLFVFLCFVLFCLCVTTTGCTVKEAGKFNNKANIDLYDSWHLILIFRFSFYSFSVFLCRIRQCKEENCIDESQKPISKLYAFFVMVSIALY